MGTTVEDFIVSSNSAENIETLVSLYEKALASHGFDKFIFSLMTEHLELKESAQQGVFRNYPDDWFSYYNENDYYNFDPVVIHGLKARNAFRWDDLSYEDPKAKKIMKEVDEAGLHNGIAIPMRSRYGAFAGISAASTEKLPLTPNALHIAKLLSFQFYECYLNLAAKSQHIPQVQLTQREQDILRYAVMGLTKVQTAEKLFISRHTVDFHIRKILLKTESPNLLSATVKAIRYEYIRL